MQDRDSSNTYLSMSVECVSKGYSEVNDAQ